MTTPILTHANLNPERGQYSGAHCACGYHAPNKSALTRHINKHAAELAEFETPEADPAEADPAEAEEAMSSLTCPLHGAGCEAWA